MSIRVALEHRTVYRYDRPVQLGPQVVRLRPAPHTRTPILAYSMKVTPAEHFVNWQQDPAGNYLARLVIPEPTEEFSVTIDLIADMTVINPFDFFVEESAKTWPFGYDRTLTHELGPYLLNAEPDPALKAWLTGVPKQSQGTIDFLIDVNRRVAGDIEYSVRMEAGVQSPAQTLQRGIGSCRDSAWLLIHALRTLGFAARFASGYLVQLAEDRPPVDGKLGPTEDYTDLHAWTEVYVPGAGWVGLDSTSGLLTGEGHIPLSCTADATASAPISGAASPAEVTFAFSNKVTRAAERPRVTKPYLNEQWDAIDALGRAVDTRLLDGDVRLTMGGEPTYVAARDQEGDEWNIDALGPTKHGLAVAFAQRLADRFATGALLQHGQGKWYPGEPLPRWEIGIRWRLDGQPLWRDPSLLAAPTDEPGTPATSEAAERLIAEIATRIGLPATAPLPVYEDPVDRLLREAKLPGGDPPDLEDPDAGDPALSKADRRAAFIAELDADRGDPVGWAMPLHRGPGDDRWDSGTWKLRRGAVYLIPGDSPIGLRLPLDSLTWTPPVPDPELSQFAAVGPIVPRVKPLPAEEREPPPITSLCVEVREGLLYVFLPPLTVYEDALELIGIVEDAAAACAQPVVLEGYAPPRDPRGRSFTVTPDPGVIEVNIDPSDSWEALVEKTDVLDDAARRTGLATEKFATDGLHTGTGGGSHLTLGGVTPPESPFLRRPDLLESLVTFWQHHPSLSYLFSGRFIGPTSQAPRVDEARHENLYEIEIAFAELARLKAEMEDDAPVPGWRVDRALRDLLTDLTGNTHRAEFCIDKLYNPSSESGRLGVVELRGFEMPPHPRMALVQGLLVRALVARFWETPYRGPLVRWGTELHDRFLLPWWCEKDIKDVVADLRAHGIAFEDSWLDPFTEFRFPLLGTAHVDGLTLELRMGIEPWNVLGEQDGAGTARYVDSSLERVQLKVDGLVAERHLVTCNGVPVPLQPTELAGTHVGGVRYRAWQPWSALHPTIEIQSPLVFDVIDRWSGRSVGGCTYHVVHPGGRSYDTFPINASEAQSRRAARFEAAGHTPGPVDVAEVEARAVRSPEYLRTLDLRRAGGR